MIGVTMPSDEFPVGTVLTFQNSFNSAMFSTYEVKHVGTKQLKAVRLDGPMTGDRASFSFAQARKAYAIEKPADDS
jgi:hypothetical protein